MNEKRVAADASKFGVAKKQLPKSSYPRHLLRVAILDLRKLRRAQGVFLAVRTLQRRGDGSIDHRRSDSTVTPPLLTPCQSCATPWPESAHASTLHRTRCPFVHHILLCTPPDASPILSTSTRYVVLIGCQKTAPAEHAHAFTRCHNLRVHQPSSFCSAGTHTPSTKSHQSCLTCDPCASRCLITSIGTRSL